MWSKKTRKREGMVRVFVHGLGQTAQSWDAVLKNINQNQTDVCVDLARFGGDSAPAYENLYSAFSRHCHSFEEKIDLCGLSLGGVLSLNFAINNPDKVNSLALINTPYKMPRTLLRLQSVLFRLLPGSSFRSTGFGKNAFLSLTRSMENLDFQDGLQRVNCPVLVIYGEKDKMNKMAAVELSELMKNADLKMIRNAGHEVNADQPLLLAEALNEFYKSHSDLSA